MNTMSDFYLNVQILDKDGPTPVKLIIVHVQPNQSITQLHLPQEHGESAQILVTPWNLRNRLSKTDEYISHIDAIHYIKEALKFSRDMKLSQQLREYEQTVGSWYFEDISDKYAALKLKQACAKRIQTKWRECISNPYHPICKKRLQNEFVTLS
jgi:hypothetical protein